MIASLPQHSAVYKKALHLLQDFKNLVTWHGFIKAILAQVYTSGVAESLVLAA